MIINTLSPTGLASTVWSTSPRKLTSLANCLGVPAGGSGFPAAFPALAVANIVPPASTFWDLSFGFTAGAAGTFTIQLFDGIVTVTVMVVAAGQHALVNIKLNPNIQMIMTNNDAVNTVPVLWSGYEWLAS